MRIRYNAQAVDALRTSRVHQNRLQNAIGSLSSGKSLNAAKDAPADVYQSDVLKSKVHGLGQATDNVENSFSLLQSAQSHLEDISSILTDRNIKILMMVSSKNVWKVLNVICSEAVP